MKTFTSLYKSLFVCLALVGVLCTLSQPALAQPIESGIVDESTGEVYGPGEAVPCSQSMLGFPAWYRGLVKDGSCDIQSPNDVGGIGPFIWIIVLNIVEMILRAAGYAAVGFIIYGGYKYMISAGSPEGMVAARKTIMNAAIGLIISIAAVAIVRTVSTGIGL